MELRELEVKNTHNVETIGPILWKGISVIEDFIRHSTFVQLQKSAITYFLIIIKITSKDTRKKSDQNLTCR